MFYYLPRVFSTSQYTPPTSTVFLSCTQKHLFLFSNSVFFVFLLSLFNCLSLNLVPSSFVSLDLSEAEMLHICGNCLYSKEKHCFLCIKKKPFSWGQRELMRFACMFIFSSSLWPVRFEKHWNTQGQLLSGLMTVFQIYVACSE